MKSTSLSLIIIVVFFLCIDSNKIVAQELNPKNGTEVNKWSFEFGLGSNKAVRPFGIGYNSSEKEFFSLQNLNHFDFGFRYMLNSKFGIKSDIAFDEITNKLDNGSLPFRSLQYRIGFQGVVDLGKVFDFNTFTNSIGLLGHGGIQLSQFKSKTGAGIQEAIVESDRGLILGITPQIKLSEWTVLTTDFSVLTNLRQRLNWDGSVSVKENNLTGLLYSTTIGLTFYLGKNERHSDWFLPEISSENISNDIRKLDKIENQLNNVEKAVIADNLDTKINPKSIEDAKESDSNANKNTTQNQLETKVKEDNEIQKIVEIVEKSESLPFKYLLDIGLLNVFYDVNQDEPNSSSTNSVFGIISLLKKNPNVNVKLLGYADRIGTEQSNKELSERRAKKLFDLLVLSGISDSRLKIIGIGEDTSIPSNSKTALELARRVSVLLN